MKEIADNTVLDEIWITDSKGHAYLRNNTEVDFSFSPDRERQPQAHVFWLQRQWLSLSVAAIALRSITRPGIPLAAYLYELDRC